MSIATVYKFKNRNKKTFDRVCYNNFGRTIIYTNAEKIDANNILLELPKALTWHTCNAEEINYLDRYYRGDQPILYREKINRPEVNNKVVMNLAYELVERKTASICAEPIQYILHGTDDAKSEQISKLNMILESEDKQETDIEICRWRSICGTAYRFVDNDNGSGTLLDESPFSLSCEDPRYTFVCYYTNGKPAFSCQIRKDERNTDVYYIYTNAETFKIKGNEIIEKGTNGNGMIPVIEYPNNARRLSDIEITIQITDAINTLQSDRINSIEQFVSSWVKFVNCEVDEESFLAMREQGALVVKSNNGAENKADVDIITSELNQNQGQIVFEDLFERFLSIQGLSNRQGNGSADTKGAVELRNGHIDNELRTAINEPILKKAERNMLRLVLYRLQVKQGFTLTPSEIEIHVNHNKFNNLLVKAESLEILLRSGVAYKRAFKTVDLFSDPEQAALESKDRMEVLYPTKVEEAENTQPTEEIEVVEEGNNDGSSNT